MNRAEGSVRPAPILSIRGLSKSFDRNRVLHEVAFDVCPGEVVALLGENGAGKSTLVNIVSGSLARDAGEIVWLGRSVRFANTLSAIESGIIHVHQELSIIGALSVMENLFIGDYAAGRFGVIDRKVLRERAEALLARVQAGHIDPRQLAERLSVAEQQRLEIAKALAREARLLILDEPTASLTPHEAQALFDVIRDLRDRNVGIVFIGHRLAEIFAIADRIVVLRDGRLVRDAPAAELGEDDVIADMTGRAFTAFETVRRSTVDGVVVMSADEVIGNQVGPLNFNLRKGEVLGLFGLVGSGRTEVLELLCGLARPEAGQLSRGQMGPAPKQPSEAWRSGIAFLPEGRKLNGILPSLPVRENIVVAPRQQGPALIDQTTERRMAEERKAELDIVADLAQPVRHLSGGNQQKTLLARCLAAEPQILLLDEPTHGVDVRTKADIYRTIRRLAQEGTSIVFASSELPEVLALADTVMVLAHGRQTMLAPSAGLRQEDVLAAAFKAA